MDGFQVERDENGFRLQPGASEFRILQVTDIHLSNFLPYDKCCLKSIARLARIARAQLVVLTGDIFGLRKVKAMKRAARAFDNIVGKTCPWTFAWGNHDQQLASFKTDPRLQLDEVEEFLEKLPGCLYMKTREKFEAMAGKSISVDAREKEAWQPLLGEDGGPCPVHGQGLPVGLEREAIARWDGFYGGNFRLQVSSPSTSRAAWQVFILNSRRAFHLPPVVLDWMDQVILGNGNENAIPAICFFHVPNKAYNDIVEKGVATGIKREKVCSEKEDGTVHSRFTRMGVIKACFAGHDHVNDYHGILDGIDYIYGRKTCMGGYGSKAEEPKKLEPGRKAIRIGGKLVILGLEEDRSEENFVKHSTIFPDGRRWEPERLVNPGTQPG